jgi:hypothetical protein
LNSCGHALSIKHSHLTPHEQRNQICFSSRRSSITVYVVMAESFQRQRTGYCSQKDGFRSAPFASEAVSRKMRASASATMMLVLPILNMMEPVVNYL